MITTKLLKDIYTEARPIIERHLDDSDLLAGLREVVAAQGGDWSSLKALITADVKDGRDEAGDGKRVKKILDKADYSAAYADMLGLANMNERNFSADDEVTAEDVRGIFKPDAPHDHETGEVIEEAALHNPRESGAAHAEEAAPAIRAVNAAPVGEIDIPSFLDRRPKRQVELA